MATHWKQAGHMFRLFNVGTSITEIY